MDYQIDERNVLFWCHFECIDLAFMERVERNNSSIGC